MQCDFRRQWLHPSLPGREKTSQRAACEDIESVTLCVDSSYPSPRKEKAGSGGGDVKAGRRTSGGGITHGRRAAAEK